MEKVFLGNADSFEGGLLRLLNVLFVVGVTTHKRTEPTTEGGEDFSVEEGHPL